MKKSFAAELLGLRVARQIRLEAALGCFDIRSPLTILFAVEDAQALFFKHIQEMCLGKRQPLLLLFLL